MLKNSPSVIYFQQVVNSEDVGARDAAVQNLSKTSRVTFFPAKWNRDQRRPPKLSMRSKSVDETVLVRNKIQ